MLCNGEKSKQNFLKIATDCCIENNNSTNELRLKYHVESSDTIVTPPSLILDNKIQHSL